MKLIIDYYGKFDVYSVTYSIDEDGMPIDICIVASSDVIKELNDNNLLGNYHLDSLTDPKTGKLYSESLSARLPNFQIIEADKAYFINERLELIPNSK